MWHVGRLGIRAPEGYQWGGVKGRSAMDTAWDAALEAELAGRQPDYGRAAALLDLSKCYERIPLHLLGGQASEHGWHPRVVAVALAQYAAVGFVSAKVQGLQSLYAKIP